MSTNTHITSRQNAKIKQVRALRQRKERQASGLFMVEGLFHIGTALETGTDFEYAIYSPELLGEGFDRELISELQESDVPLYTTTQDIFTSLMEKEGPQGLLAVAKQGNHTLDDLPTGNDSCLVALEAPQDPGNLGTVMRTIDGLGAHGLVILGGGVDLYHPTAVRAGMGTHFWLPVGRAELAEFLAWTGSGGVHLYGSSAKRGEALDEAGRFERPSVLLMGSEREGLSQEALAACERVLRLSMHGRVTSLNLAVAAGILLQAVLSQSE